MRVLLIEDEPTTAKSIELMLQNANLNVYATDLGEEGIDLKAWRQAPVLEVGDQVCDELGRVYEIELSSERNLNLRQITYLH